MAENFPNLKMEIDIQIQVAHRHPNNMNPKKSIETNFYEIIESKTDWILKTRREKQFVTYETTITSWANFLTETLQTEGEWDDISKGWSKKGNKYQLRSQYPANSLKNKGMIDFLRQTKGRRIHHHYICFCRNTTEYYITEIMVDK